MEDIKELIKSIETAIGKKFRGKSNLEEALTHRSFINESTNKELRDNERFEFLGDAVLQLIISDHLMRNHPTHQEGLLSKYRSLVVNEKSLAEVARSIDLGKYIVLGKGEEITQGRKKDSILANALEAVIAAIYISCGLESARKFVLFYTDQILRDIGEGSDRGDFKTLLQEMTQRLMKKVPQYRLVQESGPDHDKVFASEVIIDDKVYGTGKAKSKKDSEQISAKMALEALKDVK